MYRMVQYCIALSFQGPVKGVVVYEDTKIDATIKFVHTVHTWCPIIKQFFDPKRGTKTVSEEDSSSPIKIMKIQLGIGTFELQIALCRNTYPSPLPPRLLSTHRCKDQ